MMLLILRPRELRGFAACLAREAVLLMLVARVGRGVARVYTEAGLAHVGSDIEVLRRPAEQQVADASPDEVPLVTGMREPVQDLQGVRIDLAPGDGVLAARPDPRRCFRRVLDPGVVCLGRRTRIANLWS